MNMRAGMCLAVVLPLAGLAGEAVLGVSGAVRVASPDVTFQGTLYTAGWKKSVQGVGKEAPDANGRCAFLLHASDKERADGSVELKAADAGAVHVAYALTPQKDVRLSGLYVGFTLSARRLVGASWKADDKSGVFPEAFGKMILLSAPVKRLEVSLPPPRSERLTLAFDEPTPVLIQDDRKWGESFSFRLGGRGDMTYAAGVPVRVAFTLATHEPLSVVYDRPVTLQAGDEWIPLVYKKEIIPGSALDFSGMGFVDAPAGKYGWLQAKGPHFEFEKKPGVVQRFYGVNFCFSANFPSAEQAEQIADRMVRLGYNTVRIHHYDGGCVEGSADNVTLNTNQMAKLDAFLAACYTRGLYATTDLYVSRGVTWRQIGIDRPGEVDKQIYKTLVPVYEPAYQHWAAFARAFLTHVNPHTGRRYADEPGLPFISLINEGTMAWKLKQESELQPMQEAWKAWLSERRAADATAFADVPDAMPSDFGGKGGAAAALFMADVEGKMVARMKAFLRDELHCRALVTSQNCGPHYTPMQATRETQYDYVDDHFYVDHPQFVERSWALPSRCANENPIRAENRAPNSAAFTRLVDKPFAVSEFNYSAPGMFRGVGGILTGAMGALQDWGAIWRFAYAHQLENVFDDQRAIHYFDVSTDPLGQASERASLCLFLRGDLAPASERVTVLLPPKTLAVPGDKAIPVAPDWSWAAWTARVGTRVADQGVADEQGISFEEAYKAGAGKRLGLLGRTSDAFSLDVARGSFTLVTERTCGGFAEDGAINAGPLRVTVSGAPATVWVSTLDRTSVTSGKRLLLTHLTDVQNSGTKYAERARKTLLAWGKTPCLVRAGQAEVSLALAKPAVYTVYALATTGERTEKIPVHVKDGRLGFTASVAGGTQGARMLYEIVRE